MPSAEPDRLPLPDLLAGLQASGDGGFSLHVPADWMQGRTLYGGVSAALCLSAARQAFPGLPPLRSAQFSFVGPASGDVHLQATMLRQGKSAAFVNTDLTSDAGHGTRAVLCFGSPRESLLRHDVLALPAVPTPDAAVDFFGGRRGPQFAIHFEVRLAAGSRPTDGASEADLCLWIRPLDGETQPLEALWLALADMPPPAAMSLMRDWAPVSTMSWMVDVLTPGHVPADGWYLIRTTSRHVADGYAEQTMLMWASDGTPLISAHQSVAVFG
jgi:acyl-CoA thioesterase